MPVDKNGISYQNHNLTFAKSDINVSDEKNVSHIGTKDYAAYFPSGVSAGADLDRSRAYLQPGSEQFWNSVKTLPQAIGATIIGDVGSMLDLEDYANSDLEMGNVLKRWSMNYVDELHKDNPIYRVNPGKSFDLSDSGYWFENGRGLAESAGAFLVEGYITGGVASAFLKGTTQGAKLGANFIKNIFREEKVAGSLAKVLTAGEKSFVQGMSGLTSSTILNQVESVGSAIGVYDATYKAMINNGMTDEDARKRAADAAAYTINLNRINILLNITSASAFLKPISSANNLVSKMNWKSTLANLGKEAAQEFAEEQINYVSEQAGMARGKGKDLTFSEMVSEAFSKEGFEAGVLGAIGGIVQTAGVEGFNALSSNKFKLGIYDQKSDSFISKRDYNNQLYSEQERLREDDKKIFSDIGAVPKLASVFRTGEATIAHVKEIKKLETDAEAFKAEGKISEYDKLVLKINEKKQEHLAFAAFEHFEAGASEIIKDLYTRIANGEAPQGAETNPNSPDYYKTKANEALMMINKLEKAYDQSKEYKNFAEVYSNRANKIIKTDELAKLNNELIELRFKAEERVASEIKNGNINTVVEFTPEGKKEAVIDYDNLAEDLAFTFLGETYFPTEEEKDIFSIKNSTLKEKLYSLKEVKDFFTKNENRKAKEKTLDSLNKRFDEITNNVFQEKIAKEENQRIQSAIKKINTIDNIDEIDSLITEHKASDESPEIIKALQKRKLDLENKAKLAEEERKKAEKKSKELKEITKNGEESPEKLLTDEETSSKDKGKIVEAIAVPNKVKAEHDPTIFQGESETKESLKAAEDLKEKSNIGKGIAYGDPADNKFNKSGQLANETNSGLAEYLHDYRINKIGEKLLFETEENIVGRDLSALDIDNISIRMYVLNSDGSKKSYNGKEIFGWYRKPNGNLSIKARRKELLSLLTQGKKVTTEITSIGDGYKHWEEEYVSPISLFGKGTIFVEDGTGMVVKKAVNGIRQLGEINGKTVFEFWPKSTKGKVRFANEKTITPDNKPYPVPLEIKKLGPKGASVIIGILENLYEGKKLKSREVVEKNLLELAGIKGLDLSQALNLYFFKSRNQEKNTIYFDFEGKGKERKLIVSYWEKVGNSTQYVSRDYNELKKTGERDTLLRPSLESSYRSVNIEMTGKKLSDQDVLNLKNNFSITDEKGTRTYTPDTLYDDFLFQEGILTTNLATYDVVPGVKTLASKPFVDFKENPSDWTVENAKKPEQFKAKEKVTKEDVQGIPTEMWTLIADDAEMKNLVKEDIIVGDNAIIETINLEEKTISIKETSSTLDIKDTKIPSLPKQETIETKDDLLKAFNSNEYSSIFEEEGVFDAKDIISLKDSEVKEIITKICKS